MTISKGGWLFIGMAIGSSAGVGVTYIYMKDKFESRLNEEVNALKTHYIERDREIAKRNEEQKKELEPRIFTKEEVNEFVNYANMYITNPEKQEVIEEDVSAATEIISDVDFEDPDFDTYKKISVDYFEDGAVFETLSGEELDGFESIAGDEWKTAFGEYTPNVVYVRNHELKTDYEIIEQEGPHPYPGEE